MAYEKQTWQCGDTISAEKLNHMEDGIAEGGGSSKLVVNATTDAGTNVKTLDKTWQEIFDASPNVVLQEQVLGNVTLWTALSTMSTASGEDKGYQVDFNESQYYAATANDYPDSDDGSFG